MFSTRPMPTSGRTEPPPLIDPEITAANNFNPAFATPDKDVVLHYLSDPLMGFRLATVATRASACTNLTQTQRLDGFVAKAKAEFLDWLNSFKVHSPEIKLRFFSGDVFALTELLQRQRESVYQDRVHFTCTHLDKDIYQSKQDSAPAKFDIIDTSNLTDHLGALNLLASGCPLLDNQPWATIYTETPHPTDKSPSEALGDLVLGQVQTISLLINLIPIDVVTNTTSTYTNGEINKSIGRLAWKRPIHESSYPLSEQKLSSPKICWSPQNLARVLHGIFLSMFPVGLMHQMLSGEQHPALQISRKLPVYQSASYAAFLRLVKNSVSTNWNETMRYLLHLLAREPSTSMRTLFMQEVLVWLHILGVYTTDIMSAQPALSHSALHRDPRGLKAWKDIPPVIAITLQVPRKNLAFFTSGNVQTLCGTPPIECAVTNYKWENSFAALQIGFGKLTTRGTRHSNDFHVIIENDDKGWMGKSPLLVSFYIPTWQILNEDFGRLFGSLRLSMSPQAIATFGEQLGNTRLLVFEAGFQDIKNVFLTKSLPNTKETTPRKGDDAETAVHNATWVAEENNEAKCSVTVIVEDNGASNSSTKATGLISRIDIKQDTAKKLLQAGCTVSTKALSPTTSEVVLGDNNHSFLLNFPLAVVKTTIKCRIARKSSYIELVGKISNKIEPSSMFPIVWTPAMNMSEKGTNNPMLWNMPHINLAKQPNLPINPNKTEKLDMQWLWLHLHECLSPRERSAARSATPLNNQEQAVHDLKQSILSMILHVAGLGPDDKDSANTSCVFGVTCTETKGVDLLVCVSALKLDLSNGTVVLDAAVLPYPDEAERLLLYQAQMFVLAVGGFTEIKVSKAELDLWKVYLPVCAERCREGKSHGDGWLHEVTSCEYLAAGPFANNDPNPHRSFLCSCSQGKFPNDYRLINPGHGWEAIKKYATRVAISPTFTSPLVGDTPVTSAKAFPVDRQPTSTSRDPMQFPSDMFDRLHHEEHAGESRRAAYAFEEMMGHDVGGNRSSTSMLKCHNCGKRDGSMAEKDGANIELKACATCKKVRYCSRGCQRADWKKGHKSSCGK